MDGKVGANTWNAIYAKYTAAHGLHVPYPGIVLRQGDSGGTVRLVQQKLRGEGETLTADGAGCKYGAKTTEAVRRYQKRNSLTADGSVGSATWEKMSLGTPCPHLVMGRKMPLPILPGVGPFSLQRGNSAYLFLYISS